MTIKGCQKKVINVKTTGSKYFDEAYFVLKDETYDCDSASDDMIAEANRIIEKSIAPDRVKRSRRHIHYIAISAISLASLIVSVVLLIIK